MSDIIKNAATFRTVLTKVLSVFSSAEKKLFLSCFFVTEVSKMDPSYYSPQPTSSRVHAVCYCRVHGNSAQMSPRNYPHPHQLYTPQHFDPGSRLSIDPPSPVTRQLMQKHPEAVVIQTGKHASCVTLIGGVNSSKT